MTNTLGNRTRTSQVNSKPGRAEGQASDKGPDSFGHLQWPPATTDQRNIVGRPGHAPGLHGESRHRALDQANSCEAHLLLHSGTKVRIDANNLIQKMK